MYHYRGVGVNGKKITQFRLSDFSGGLAGGCRLKSVAAAEFTLH
jgi:hypothetical protein